jgi:hypothetical protein
MRYAEAVLSPINDFEIGSSTRTQFFPGPSTLWAKKGPAPFDVEPLLRASRVPVSPAPHCAFPVATFRCACTTLCIHRVSMKLSEQLHWKEDADVVRAYLALKAHHRHNKPPSTMLAATAVMLPTIHSMNNSYNMMCVPYVSQPPQFLRQLILIRGPAGSVVHLTLLNVYLPARCESVALSAQCLASPVSRRLGREGSEHIDRT